MYPGPPDITTLDPNKNQGEFISGLGYHGYDEGKLRSLEVKDLEEIAALLKTSNNPNSDPTIHRKINQLSEAKLKKEAENKLTTPLRAPAFRKKGVGGRKTRRRPRKRR